MRKKALSLLLALAIVSTGSAQSLPELGDSSSAILSPQMERRIGEEAYRDIRLREPDFVDDPEILNYVKPVLLTGKILDIIIRILNRIYTAHEVHTKNTERMKNMIGEGETKSVIISIIYHMFWNGLTVILGKYKGLIKYSFYPISYTLGNTVFKQ